MKNELARNPRRRHPRRRPRNPKLSRGQKVGIALVSVAAVGGVTALVVMMRRKPKRDTPFCGMQNGQPMLWNDETQQCEPASGGQGSGGGVSGVAGLLRARRRFCINPNALTLEQRVLLQEQIFLPILESLPSPGALGAATTLAAAALQELCPGAAQAATRQMAATLAQATWENYVGFKG